MYVIYGIEENSDFRGLIYREIGNAETLEEATALEREALESGACTQTATRNEWRNVTRNGKLIAMRPPKKGESVTFESARKEK